MRRKRAIALVCEELEPRLLLSADLAGIAVDFTTNDSESPDTEIDLQLIEDELLGESLIQSDESEPATRELVIIDPTTADHQSLVDDLINRNREGRNFEIVLLDDSGSGIAQLSGTLAQYQGLDAIHLISHGSDGEIHLLNEVIDQSRVQSDPEIFSSWGQSLAADGDLLIYGCDLAATVEGKAFIDLLAQATGTDIAASDDRTGHAGLGGDWDFEYQVGTVTNDIVFSVEVVASWQETLVIASFQEGVSGYTGVQDTDIYSFQPNTSFGNYIDVIVNDPSQQALIRFDNLFGAGAGQVPLGSTINSATLSVYVENTDPLDSLGVYEMLTSWSEFSTWNSMGNGISTNGVEAASTSLFTINAGLSGWVDITGITATVQDWADGGSNNGFALISYGNADNWVFNSSEYNLVSLRPVLTIDYTPNVAPVLDSASLTLDEGETVILSGANFGITDPDDTSFTYNLSSISGGRFELTTAPGASINSFNSVQLAANQVVFVDNGDEVAPGFDVTVNDGVADSNTLSASITYTPVSDATPLANADNITVAEGDTATTLVGGSASVLNNDTGLDDVPVTVSLVSDVSNGTLTLNSDGTFSYTHDGSENFNDAFTYRVTDNDGQTSDATVTITVTPVSDATPLANADNITVAEGDTATTLVGGSASVLNNDTGLGDTPVTVSLVSDVSNGTLTLNGDGTFSYTHDGSENFNDAFTYRVTDNDGQTSDATVTITVTPVSDATPVASADSINGVVGGTVTTLVGGSATVLNNDTGLGDTPVIVSLVTDVVHGTLTLNSDGTFSYTHDGSLNYLDSFIYRVTDNDGQTSDATVSIDVTPVGVATPVANSDSITVAEGGTTNLLSDGITTSVLGNDTGLDDVPVTVSLLSDVSNGALTLNGDGTFSYSHDGSENFSDSFTYRVTDNDGQTSDATVTIAITPVSDTTPVANSDSISVAEGGTTTTLVGGSATVLNNDTGLGDTPVTVSLVTDVNHGTLTLNGDGTFSYSHNGSENFSDSFTYRVTDNDGQTSDATVTIAITPVSDTTPVANSDSISVAEGGTTTTLVGGSATVLNNDTGLGDTPVTVSLVTDVNHGTLTLNGDGTFSYSHNGSENFSDSFTYRVTDNDGQTSDATVTIAITPVSDTTPVANSDSISVAEGGTITTLVGGSATVLNNDTGLGDTPVTVSLVTDVNHGTLTLNGDGTFSYSHNGSENFSDSFTYRVTDNDGQTSDATVTIAITPVSDTTPVANSDSISVAEGGTTTTLVGGSATVLNNDTGLGDTPVTVSLVTDVNHGTLTLNGDGTFSYSHNGSENFSDSFTYRVTDNDGQTSDATVTIAITPVSDTTPVANSDSISVAEGGTTTTLVGGSATVLNNDTGLGDTPVTVSLVTDVNHGTLTLNGDGTFSYSHDGSENFSDSFTYRVTDNDGQTSDATVTIAITPVSDTTPVANSDSISVAEGGTTTTLVGGSATVLNNDTGLGDTPVTVSLVTDVNHGTLTLNGDGTFSYSHNGSENFSDSFTYRVTDNDGQTSDATVTIAITPVSDTTPVANSDSISVAEGGTTTTLVGGSATVLNNDTGLGDTPVTVSLVTDVNHGTLTLNGDGTFSYSHNGSENFSDSFTYRVTDNDGQTSDATVTIAITPVSDTTPVANSDSISVAEGGTITTLVGGSATVLNNDTGLGDTPVTVSLVTDVNHGTLTLNGDGTFSYSHNGSENFSDSFTYRVTDNDGQSNVATVNINIISVNSAPEASSTTISVTEDTIYTGTLPVASDADGDSVSYQLENASANGSVTVYEDGRVSYAPDADYHGPDGFVYSVSDGNGGMNSYSVAIDVVAVNDAPVINTHSDSGLLVVDENTTYVTTIAVEDPDNDNLTIAIDGGTDLGLFSIDPATGELVFNTAPDRENPLDANQDNLYQVELLVSDGNGGSDRQVYTIEVRDVNEFDVGLLMDIEDTPDMISTSSSVNDGVGITVWAEDPDSENNLISYSLDDDAGGLFAVDPSSGVITLVSGLGDRETSQFEITVRATSEDGSFSIHTFGIALTRTVETSVDPEEPFLDEIIFDLNPEPPIVTAAPAIIESGQDAGQSLASTALDDTDEHKHGSEVADALLENTGVDPTVSSTDPERHFIKQLSASLFGADDRNANGFDFVKVRLTPTPVTPDELPQFNTNSGDVIEVPETIWYLLDAMGREMSDHRDEQSSSDGLVLQSAALGTVTLSAGYVAWLLRAGVLSASLLSSAPLWRQVDPLPVLSAHATRREEARDDRPDTDPEEQRLAKLFDHKNKPRQSGSTRKDV